MARKIFLFTILSVSLGVGGVWALQAQDPTAPQTPTKPAPQTSATPKTEPQTTTMATTQVDLSGTYAGTFNCEAAGLDRKSVV